MHRQAPKVQSDCLETEEDSGTWCYCREDKGGEMIACDSKACHIKWIPVLGCQDLLYLKENGHAQHAIQVNIKQKFKLLSLFYPIMHDY